MTLLIQVLAGLGIFLYGMTSLEAGIEALGSQRLKTLLRRSTGTPIASAGLGALVTALLQSSSMVSLLVLAFASAGLMPLFNAIGIIIGSNLGTTFTGWIVATIGFKLDLASLALPLLGTGGLFQIVASRAGQWNSIGRVVVGLGLLLLGLSVMKDSVTVISDQWDIATLRGYPPVVYLIVGVVTTAIIQSSSATIMLTLSALYGGLIQLPEAGALVIGADLGTTSTTILGSLTGASIKRQLALAQLVFNGVVDLAAFLFLLPLLPWSLQQLNITDPLYGVVAFHSTINLLGVLIFLPFLKPFSFWIARFFVDSDDNLKKLTNISFAVPEAGLPALQNALFRIWKIGVLNNLSLFGMNYQQLALSDNAISGLAEAGKSVSQANNPERIYQRLLERESEIFQLSIKLQEAPLSTEQSTQLNAIQELARNIVYACKSVQNISRDLEHLRFSTSDSTRYLFREQRNFQGEIAAELLSALTQPKQLESLASNMDKLTLQNDAHHRRMDEAVYQSAREQAPLEPMLSIQLNINRELHHALRILIGSMSLFSLLSQSA